MPTGSGLLFFENLPVLPGFENTFDEKNFHNLPDDWILALTDVRNSTSKIESGKYKEVNAMGAVAIMAVVNLTGKFNFPFIFGGDGATIAIPGELKVQVASALKSIRIMEHDSFELDLRCVMIPLRDIRSRGQNVRVAKYGISDFFAQAAFDGGGVKLAESIMKDDLLSESYDVEGITSTSDANVEGLECRWDEVKNDRGEVHSLLIEVLETDPGKRMSLLKDIFRKINTIYGDDDQSKPITIDKLRLTLNNQKLSVENRIHTGSNSSWEYIKYWMKLRIQWLFGIVLMGFGLKSKYVDWSYYKPDLVDNSDHRKLDDMLRLVLAGTEIQRYTVQGYLEELYMQHKIVYGLHHAQSALITCVILNHHREHIHLVDGNDGGYAMAAKNLKVRKSRIES